MRSVIFGAAVLAGIAQAHMAPWHKGMYCRDGNGDGVDNNAYTIVHPAYQLPQDQWWFHAFDGCDKKPPSDGAFLELPAGGSFTVEMAANRGKTSLSFNSKFATDWGDGETHPDDYADPNCINSPQLHAQNYSMVAGSAFAISYHPTLDGVTPENLVVFSVNYKTPWKRWASFQVPANMPACPDEGCTCAWGWIPNGCGQPNIYHTGFKCKVTGATSTKAIGVGKPPVWCEDDASKCVQGPKQMLYWNQQSGNNIEVEGYDKAGSFKSPAYNNKCGFSDGAQNDIFTGEGSTSSSSGSKNSGSGSGSSNSSGSSSSSSSASSGSQTGSSGSSGNSGSGSKASSSSASAPTPTSNANNGGSNDNNGGSNDKTSNDTTSSSSSTSTTSQSTGKCKRRRSLNKRKPALHKRSNHGHGLF